jgi:hypothetical protein
VDPRRYPYFDVVVGLAWSYDPESYAGGSLAAGRISHAGQVKGDDPDKKAYEITLLPVCVSAYHSLSLLGNSSENVFYRC